MKKLLIILNLFFLTLTVFSQSIQTYSGKFKEGTVVYKYYENSDYERIYHGAFNYQGEVFNSKFTITGQYTDGLKTGFWKYTSGKNSIEGEYIAGELNGLWIEKTTKNNNIITKTSITFKNGRFVDDYFYSDDYITVTGKFDENGLLDGEWKFTYKYFDDNLEDIQRYKNGILFWRLKRNLETGEVLKKFDKTSFVDSFYTNLDTITKTSEINGVIYISLPYISEEFGIYNPQYEYFEEGCAFNHEDNNWASIGHWLYFAKEQSEIYYTGFITYLAYQSLLKEYNPVQIIVPYDISWRKKEDEERQKAELSRIQKEKEKAELIAFLEKRKTTLYNLYETNLNDYNLLNVKIENLIQTEISNYTSLNIEISGEIKYLSDTLGTKSVDLTNLVSNNSEFLNKIKIKLSQLEIKSVTERNYKFNTFASFSVNLTCYKGQTEFSLKIKKGIPTFTYITENPDEQIDKEIQKYFANKEKGKYKISYLIIQKNGVITSDFTIISND